MRSIGFNFKKGAIMAETENKQKAKNNFFYADLKWHENLAIGWPLILIFVGGAIGGACGGLAYYYGGKVFKSELSSFKKYLYAFLIGIGSIALYVLAVFILALIFPGLFSQS
jgi:hypothetical protein